ncbi:MAG: bifunctional aspartate kinase/homoserine dehydrogenase I [Bdellovibrionales bacterium]
MPKWKVHKFGGTSVLDAGRYRNVAKIIEGTGSGPKAVVVSAMKGTTDDLLNAVEMARAQNSEYSKLLVKIHERHNREAIVLLGEKNPLLEVFAADFLELGEILRGVWLVKTAGQDVLDRVSGMGEVWSAQILNAYFSGQGKKSAWLDARKVLVVKHSDGRVLIDWEKSTQKLSAWMKQNPQELLTVTGFVASTVEGTATTLGRNGSDYSASIFGALFDCDEVFIWTDVDGVLSADPRLVPEAVILNEMSYSEITELAYFGAKVVHPSTMAPAIGKQIPIWIKNSLRPDMPGTKIHSGAKSDRAVKGFSTIDGMCMINVEGTGMAGIPGVAERLFGALRSAGVSVVLISQASSEHSICLAITEMQSEVARKVIEQAFASEIHQKLIQQVQVTKGVSILAAVGDNMAHTPGIAGKFFTALGRSGVSVSAIAQGSSERNISAVIQSKDSVKALRTVHSSFILPHQTFSIGMIGVGLIGGTFLKQLNSRLDELRRVRKVDFKIRALANSKTMLLSEDEIQLDQWEAQLTAQGQPLDLKRFAAHLSLSHIPHSVLIEATASSALSPHYCEWLTQGLHVISPNKKANTGSMREYLAIREAAQKSSRHFLYSTNVGAGLPIIQTLRDLYATGDEILAIQGILSGTLSFIFNQYDGSKPFSEIVKLAKAKGYTEPDPREDLSGQDVVRKLVILARETGLQVEVSDVEVQGLVPESLQSVSVDDFLKRLTELDQPMQKRWQEAKSRKEVLRFVASVDQKGKARVALESLPESHAFAHVSGTDNIVLFKTARYLHQPLVVQGPGAGPEVTAAGVFADLLRLSQYLGAIP